MAEIVTEHGIREVLDWDEFGIATRQLAQQVVDSGFTPDVVVAIARGGLVPGGAMAYALGTKGVGTMNVEFYTDIGQTLTDPRLLPPLMDTQELADQKFLSWTMSPTRGAPLLWSWTCSRNKGPKPGQRCCTQNHAR